MFVNIPRVMCARNSFYTWMPVIVNYLLIKVGMAWGWQKGQNFFFCGWTKAICTEMQDREPTNKIHIQLMLVITQQTLNTHCLYVQVTSFTIGSFRYKVKQWTLMSFKWINGWSKIKFCLICYGLTICFIT